MSKDFFEFSYQQYKLELSEADKFYSKAGILVSALAILGGLAYRLSEPATLLTWRLDLSTCRNLVEILSVCALLKTLWHTCQMVRPRKGYEALAPVRVWHDWLKKRAERVEKMPPCKIDEVKSEEDAIIAFMSEIIPRLAEAQEKNAQLNEQRRESFRKAVDWLFRFAFFLLIQAVFHLAIYLWGLHLQGVAA
ncbi:MAG TPA: hypothetical protein PLO37_19465 [Candidatus Hydrogenedentes bacterium]|nr:hypothetical protein [Candidatus Hydrogenedentota bacterium]